MTIDQINFFYAISVLKKFLIQYFWFNISNIRGLGSPSERIFWIVFVWKHSYNLKNLLPFLLWSFPLILEKILICRPSEIKSWRRAWTVRCVHRCVLRYPSTGSSSGAWTTLKVVEIATQDNCRRNIFLVFKVWAYGFIGSVIYTKSKIHIRFARA